MNARSNLLAAAVLLCAIVVCVVKQPPVKQTGPARSVSAARQTHDLKITHSASGAGLTMLEDKAESLRPHASSPSGDSTSIAEAFSNPAVNPEDATVGVRLSRDVRLPVTSFGKTPESIATPEISMVHQEIENRFYRELLDQTLRTPRKNSGEADDIPIDENGEKTVTIEPGPESDAALDRSDEAFRSLFGNDAYNRRKMEGTMELGASNKPSGD